MGDGLGSRIEEGIGRSERFERRLRDRSSPFGGRSRFSLVYSCTARSAKEFKSCYLSLV